MGKTKIVELTAEQRADLEIRLSNWQKSLFSPSLSDDFAEKRKAHFSESRRSFGMLRDGRQQLAGPLSSRRYGRFGNAGGQRTTADFECSESGASEESRGGNKKTSELGQDRGRRVRGGAGFSDAPGNSQAISKKNEYRFCRARTWLKPRQVAQEREEKEKQLKILWWLYLGGRIDLYFGDESAFSMNPKLPYGWSPKGERIRIFPRAR